MGSPSGRRNSAVTANQSARPPTTPASAIAPIQPPHQVARTGYVTIASPAAASSTAKAIRRFGRTLPLLQKKVEHAFSRARARRVRVRGTDLATTPRVAHPGNQPGLEPGTTRGVTIDGIDAARAAILRARRDASQAREHQRQRVEVHGIHDDVVGSVPERGSDAGGAGAHGAPARRRRLLTVHVLPEHALKPGIDADATPVRATGG